MRRRVVRQILGEMVSLQLVLFRSVLALVPRKVLLPLVSVPRLESQCCLPIWLLMWAELRPWC